MRIAVCLSGGERLGSQALTQFARQLPPDAEVDCYFYFWEGGPLSDELAIAKAVHQKVEGRFNTITPAVGRDFAMDLQLDNVQVYPETNVENVVRMYRSIRRCNDMKLWREQQQGFVYDYVIRMRSDVLISTDLELDKFMPLTREFIVFPENGHWRGGLCDQFAFGSSKMMDVYASVHDHIVEHVRGGCVFHPETLLRHHLMKMRALPILAPITATILRDQ